MAVGNAAYISRVSILQEILHREWWSASKEPTVMSILNPPTLSDRGKLSEDVRSEARTVNKSNSAKSSFMVVRDDLIHPYVGGNKVRKLDAVIPLLEKWHITGVVTCGGAQSSHTVAVACACAEIGIDSHVLIRGEKLQVPTGNALLASMFASTVTYVPRSVYADRERMLEAHALSLCTANGQVLWLRDLTSTPPSQVSCAGGQQRLLIIPEGGSDLLALYGLVRLVHRLSSAIPAQRPVSLVVDSGTGTTAVGVALGVALCSLPWTVVGVCLCGDPAAYAEHQRSLTAQFLTCHPAAAAALEPETPLTWLRRPRPRKFGRLIDGDVRLCRQLAQQTGVLVDPVYSLAAYEEAQRRWSGGESVVMLHTGGAAGLFGLAQRFAEAF